MGSSKIHRIQRTGKLQIANSLFWGPDSGWYMDVSENSGTPKSSTLIGFSIINHPFLGTPIFGNTHLDTSSRSHDIFQDAVRFCLISMALHRGIVGDEARSYCQDLIGLLGCQMGLPKQGVWGLDSFRLIPQELGS